MFSPSCSINVQQIDRVLVLSGNQPTANTTNLFWHLVLKKKTHTRDKYQARLALAGTTSAETQLTSKIPCRKCWFKKTTGLCSQMTSHKTNSKQRKSTIGSPKTRSCSRWIECSCLLSPTAKLHNNLPIEAMDSKSKACSPPTSGQSRGCCLPLCQRCPRRASWTISSEAYSRIWS